MSKERFDPIASPLSSYQDIVDKLKLVPRMVVLLFALTYVYAVYKNMDADVVYQTGMFLSVMTIAYVIGVDSLKDVIDALLKNKGVNVDLNGKKEIQDEA